MSVKRIRHRELAVVAVIVAVASILVLGFFLRRHIDPPDRCTPIARRPVIAPDYAGLVVPPNIAPLNFAVHESGDAFRVRIQGSRGESIDVADRDGRIEIPSDQWHALLAANVGGQIETEICCRGSGGVWSRFEKIVNTVACEPIDGWLVYRFFDPVYRCWGNIAIQQRNLTNFNEKPIVENRSFDYDCVNCHSFSPQQPDVMALQVRSQKQGARLLVSHDGHVDTVNTAGTFNHLPASYLAWHPSGRAIAFASIKVTQFFHAKGETRDVFDKASDIGIYRLDSNTVLSAPAISRPDRLETYPQWSPDGKHLYYCSAPQLPMEKFQEVRYDLMRIAYDAGRETWGEPEVLLAAKDIAGSVTHPRISPDGRFVLFCLCNYGNFSIYHPESDLCLLDLSTHQWHRMEINSDRADSYHSWSSNGRWIVFSSKRRDGLLTHPYISYIDETGHAGKPFILPQQDPTWYDRSLKVFNVPELIAQPADVHAPALLAALSGSVQTTEAVGAATAVVPSSGPAVTQPDDSWRSARTAAD